MKSVNAEAILRGIYALYDADATLKAKLNFTAQFPGFYMIQPKQNAPMPFVVVSVLSVEPWDCLGEPTGEFFTYQLSVFSNKFPDPREALDIVKELTRVYDEANVVITGYGTVRNERLGSVILAPQPEKNIIHAPLRYRLFLERL